VTLPETPPRVEDLDGGEDTAISEEEAPVLFQAEHPEDVIWVSRLNEKDMKWQFVCKLLPEECTVERVAQIRGGGRYRVTLKGPDPERGHDVFKRRRSFQIDGDPHPVNMNPPTPYVAGQAPTATGGGPQRVGLDDIMSAGILNLFQTQQQVNTAMMQAVKEAKGQTTDWGKLVAAMLPLITAIVNRPQPTAPPQVDPLTMLTKVGELLKSTTSPGSSFKDVIDAMNGVLELRERAHEDDTTGDPLLDIVRENLPKVMEVIQQEQVRRGVPVTPTAEIARRLAAAGKPAVALAPGPTQPPPAAGEADVSNAGLLLNFLQARRQAWLRYATVGRSPSVCALWEWENVPASYRGTIREFLAREDIEGAFFAAVPEAKNYHQWYTDFLVSLHEAVFPEQYGDEPDSADESRGVPDEVEGEDEGEPMTEGA
jgi:hypothetical protein